MRVHADTISRFYRVGGDNRVAGFLLAGATAVLLFVGTGPIAYIRMSLVLVQILALNLHLHSCDGGRLPDLRSGYRPRQGGFMGYSPPC